GRRAARPGARRSLRPPAAMQAHHHPGERAGERAQAAGEQHRMRSYEGTDDQPDGEAGHRADYARAAGAARAGVAVHVAADWRARMLSRRTYVEGVDFAPREALALELLERGIGIEAAIEAAGNDARHQAVLLKSARRTSTLGRRMSARYLVIVRLATRSPCCASSRASSASASGARGPSAAMSAFITARTAVAEAAPPFSVAIRREKKCLNSKRPRGVAMYLLLVTRHTVDSCSPSSPAISLRVSGFIATSPYSKKPRWRATMASATRWMVAKRCSIERRSQRASCRWRASDWLEALRFWIASA